MKTKFTELDDPKKVQALTDCYLKIDYYYQMIEIAEQKRDMLIKDMSLDDIRAACEASSRR